MTTTLEDHSMPLVQVLGGSPPLPPPPFVDALKKRASSSDKPLGPSFVLPVVTLRKVTARTLFENFDQTCLDLRAPIQRMRLIDSLRYHTPTQQERSDFNIQASKERIFLHTLSDLLIICGARRGFRFASEHINQLVAQADRLKRAYEITNTLFGKLPAEILQFRFPKEQRRIEQDEPFYGQMMELYKRQQANLQSDEEVQKCVDAALVILLNDRLDVHVRALVFQQYVNEYMTDFAKLRDLVLLIRQKVAVQRPMEPTESLDALSNGKEPACELEMETKGASHPFPKFLVVLIDKYRRETSSSPKRRGWDPESNEFPMESIAHFAVFLAEMFLNPTPYTTSELQSAVEFLHVLKVEYCVDSHVNQIELQQVPRRWTNGGLSWEIFDFLSTVRELRSIPQKKELLRPRSNSSSPVRTRTKCLG